MSQLNSIKDFEEQALRDLLECVKSYYNDGEGEGITIKLNREIFNRFRILPQVVRNVSNRDISTTILGKKISMPVGVAPTGFQKMAHHDGECGNAKAAEAAKTVFILSCYSNTCIDEVAKAAPNAIKWMQTIIFKDRDLTLHMIRKAEEFGFEALVVILDNPIYGKCKRSSLNMCLEKQLVRPVIFEDYVAQNSELSYKYLKNMSKFMGDVIDDSLTWHDVAWLKSVTKLPLVLKGILTPEDALLGIKIGASAIYVSNHGGRQLDGVPATMEVLPDIVKAVGDKVEIYMDGGITRGTDVFKALALGAKMVFVGKPMLWGLTCAGEKGARAVLEILRQEVDQTFALAGCPSVKYISKDMVKHESHFFR